jgi:hypothetical protein
MYVTICLLVAIGVAASLWGRFRSDENIKEWMLNTPGLEGLCRDYLDYLDQMSSGQHDVRIIHYFDSQRQVTHNQILERLGLDRSSPIDMLEFCQRYLGKI